MCAKVNVGRAANTLMAIMWGLLQSEFETDKVNSILRGNSLCTKLETIFCRLVGQEFLQQIFGQSLLLIVTDTSLRLDTTCVQCYQKPATRPSSLGGGFLSCNVSRSLLLFDSWQLAGWRSPSVQECR